MTFLLRRNVAIGPDINTSLPRYKIFKCLLIKFCKDFNKGQYVTRNVIRLDLLCLVLLFSILILFRMGIFGAAHGWPPLPKIRHTYPTMMKLGTVILYLKKIQIIYKSRDTTPDLRQHQHFFMQNQ